MGVDITKVLPLDAEVPRGVTKYLAAFKFTILLFPPGIESAHPAGELTRDWGLRHSCRGLPAP